MHFESHRAAVGLRKSASLRRASLLSRTSRMTMDPHQHRSGALGGVKRELHAYVATGIGSGFLADLRPDGMTFESPLCGVVLYRE